jgi:DDE superfamily endonuclease
MGLAKYLLLYLARRRWKEKQKRAFRYGLNAAGRSRRQRSLPRPSLLPPTESAWEKLYKSNNEQAMITVTGFDYRAFHAMHDLFKPLFEGYSPWTETNPGYNYKPVDTNNTRGVPRIISSTQCLALVLGWYRFKGAEFVLQGWFGFTGGHTSVWLRFGRRMLVKALLAHPLARVHYPDNEGIEKLKQICKARHDVLVNVYCAADGLKIAFQSCNGLTEQSMYYNGWLHGHFITNLFVFSIDGRIIEACLNVPGSIHDSTIAHMYGTYGRLQEKFNQTGGVCVVDSAFASSNVPYLIKSSQKIAYARTAHDMVVQREATALRQAAEWGMRAIQGAFPKLKEALKYEEKGERGIILKLVPLLYNFRLEVVGLNQIQNTYVPEWSKDNDYVKLC